MRYNGIGFSFQDYPDPSASAVVVYLTGCSNNCKGCQNVKLQNPFYGEDVGDISTFVKKIKDECAKNDTHNIVFEGGDPLYTDNVFYVKSIIDLLPEYNVCIYTGCDIDTVKLSFRKHEVNFFKCGKFDIDHKRPSMKTEDKFMLASPNQNFYDSCFHKISRKGVLNFKKNIFQKIFYTVFSENKNND